MKRTQRGTSRTGRTPRSELRLALQLLGLALVVCAVAGVVAWRHVQDVLDRSLRDELARMREGGLAEIEMLRQRVATSLESAVESLPRDTLAMETVLLGPGSHVEAARRHGGGLDLFEILGESGLVLASTHEPERLGMIPDKLGPVPDDGPPMVLENPTDAMAPLVMAASRSFTYGSRPLRVRGGSRIDGRLLDRIARGGHVFLVRTADGAPTLTSSAGEALSDIAPVWIAQKERKFPDVFPGVGDDRWLVDRKELGVVPNVTEVVAEDSVEGAPNGRPPAELVYAVDYSRLGVSLGRLQRSFALLGLVVGGLAALAGVILARNVARPVDDVVRAFDAIAEGRADYTFDVRSKDAMHELPAAFSRTHRALELQRRRSAAAERVAAWREVAQHLAHEVKNPLSPIQMTVENLIKARREATARFPAMFEEGMRTILEEVQQLSRIVSEFSEFARLPLPAPRPTAIAPLIERAIELHAAEPGLIIERHIDPNLPAVTVDPDLVSRALKNVVANAVDSVRESSAKSGKEPRIEIHVRPFDGMAEIEVADNGTGLSEESVRHIFEPYFTTKPDGTGLGMTLTYRIIVDHGGTIVAENRGEGGARVVIRLPVDDGTAARPVRRSETRA